MAEWNFRDAEPDPGVVLCRAGHFASPRVDITGNAGILHSGGRRLCRRVPAPCRSRRAIAIWFDKEMNMPRLNRRQLLQTAGAGAAALALAPMTVPAAAEETAEQAPPFTLPKLPYAYDALEPYIDAETMHLHHDKHHQAYVDNLNKALSTHPELQKKTLEELLRSLDKLPEDIRTAVRNNGGGDVNHTLFWQVMAKGGGKPDGALARAIDQAFGSFDKFQDKFSQAGITRFGSGWAWLIVDKGKLEVLSTTNQDTPVMEGKTPILGLDVWEHAYYLKYKNMRPAYVKAWWNVVNWKDVAERYGATRKGS
jgi:Fe-Mn family superoxide dismutase